MSSEAVFEGLALSNPFHSDSCSVENKMQILLLLKENSQSPQLRGTTMSDSILSLSMRSPLPISKHQCSACEHWIMSCIMEEATKQLVGSTLVESGRIGMKCHCLSHGSYFCFLQHSPLLWVWEGRYWDQAAYLHILITINMYFFSICAAMFSIHIISGKSF